MDKVNILNAVDITNNRAKRFAGEKRYLATGDLSNKGIDSFTYVNYENKPSRADLMVEKGNLILARMKETNKVFLIEQDSEDIIVSTGFLTLRPTDGFEGKYLYHYFRSEIFQRSKDRFCSGATQKAINNYSFKALKVPYYQIEKQRDIALILDTADSLRQKRKTQLALLDDYLKSVFLDMFGDPVRNEKGWAQLSLGDISFDMKYGTNVKCFERSEKNSIPVLRIPNIYKSDIDLADLKYGILDKKEINYFLKRMTYCLFVQMEILILLDVVLFLT